MPSPKLEGLAESPMRSATVDEILVSREIYNIIKYADKSLKDFFANHIWDMMIYSNAIFLVGYSFEDLWIINHNGEKRISFKPDLLEYAESFEEKFEANRNDGGNLIGIKANFASDTGKQLYPDLSWLVRINDKEWVRVRRWKEDKVSCLGCSHLYSPEDSRILEYAMAELHKNKQIIELKDIKKIKSYLGIIGKKIERIRVDYDLMTELISTKRKRANVYNF